jgi:predicted ATPase/DNA-binding CsgD family transcriptional regulator
VSLSTQAGSDRNRDPTPRAGIGTLGVQLTSFVGRSSELVEVIDLLGRARLLTLTGAGGVGKTRLAIEAAKGFRAGSVYFVELAYLADPTLVGRTVLDGLGAAVTPDRPPVDVAAAYLADRTALLVMDNCEHMLEETAACVEFLLSQCPRLRILATSRAPLSASGETTWMVPPLTLPAEGDAVGLFIERARLVRPGFRPSEGDLKTIHSICGELDGLPLAIELAAARTRALGLGQIADGLADRFSLLAGGPHGSPARQRTLHASLDWSYDLLDARERILFARLAAFAGGWTLQTAAAVCCDDSLPREHLVDVLTGLIEKSLVWLRDAARVVRYGMLETVRQYAIERLEQSGEETEVRDRHLDCCVAFAERCNREYLAMTPEGREETDAELPNLRAALTRAAEVDSEAGLRIAAALAWYWRERGSYGEGVETLELALAAAPEQVTVARARAVGALGMMAGYVGDFVRAAGLQEQAAELATRAADPYALSFALGGKGLVTSFFDPAAGSGILERAAAAARESGHQILLGDALMWLVVAAVLAGDQAGLEQRIDDALAVAEPVRHRQALAWCWWARSSQAEARGDPTAARDWAQRILELDEDILEPMTTSMAVGQLAVAATLAGAGDQMRARVAAERERFRASGVVTPQVEMEIALATLDQAAGEAPLATERLQALIASGVLLAGHQGSRIQYLLAAAAVVQQDVEAALEHATAMIEMSLGSDRPKALASLVKSRAALIVGDDDRATELAHNALAIFTKYGWDTGAIDAIELLGAVAAGQGSIDYAARLIAAAGAARSERGLARVPPDSRFWDPIETKIRASASRAASDAGAELALIDAIAYVSRGRGSRDRPLQGWGSLTPTETEVAQLAAAGLNNLQIAERLFISRSTVKYHLAHVYAKLDISGRTALARISAIHRTAG